MVAGRGLVPKLLGVLLFINQLTHVYLKSHAAGINVSIEKQCKFPVLRFLRNLS